MMEVLQAIATSIGVIGLILFMLLLALHLFGTKTAAWIHSNREEKIGFSKSKLYNANGYLIHSGSELLLNSTGSFKRFDSIDRDFKPIDQTSLQSPSSCDHNHHIQAHMLQTARQSNGLNGCMVGCQENCNDINILSNLPPQPLRPAPKSPLFRNEPQENSTQEQQPENQYDGNIQISAIPRPVTKRQHSSPANCGVAQINLSEAVAKITNGPRSCTNPFLNGSLSITEDDNSNKMSDEIENSNQNFIANEKKQENPFSRRRTDERPFFSFPINGNMTDNDTVDTLIKLNEINSETVNNAQQLQQLSDIGVNNITQSLSPQVERENIVRNPFTSENLHKTVSETSLEQYSLQEIQGNLLKMDSFSRILSRQSMPVVCSDSTNSMNSNEIDLTRTMSCESVNSESSVLMADLEHQRNPTPTVTGQLCFGLQYDRSTMTDEGIELVITLMEAKDLIGPSNADEFDTFVRIYLFPDDQAPLQTKLFRNSKCPTYNETFSFWLSNKTRTKRTLCFHLYHSGCVHTLIGETEFEIGDVRRPITTWQTLSDSRHNKSPYGELMFSLSYLPTAERLTVVVVKARNLNLNEDRSNVFVKVYLLKNDKKVSKKKTSIKRSDSSPIYNESMMFSVPPHMLRSIQIRLTVVSVSDMIVASNENSNQISATTTPIGHVIVGCTASDKGLKHWNQMLISLRKPVAMWHAVRKTTYSIADTEIQSNIN